MASSVGQSNTRRGRWSVWRWLVSGTLVCVTGVAAGSLVACTRSGDGKSVFSAGGNRPDELPAMVNKELPFHYPPALYAEKAQGNVTLRLFIDTSGAVVNDSTRVVESSGILALDSAALKGAPALRFIPAKLHGTPMPISILFPVYFRHPQAPPLAGDTLLKTILPPSAAPLSQ